MPVKKDANPKKELSPQNSAALNLQEIPMIGTPQEEQISSKKDDIINSMPSNNLDISEDLEDIDDPKEILKEITPKPFQGSIIAEKGIFAVKSIEKTPIDTNQVNSTNTIESESNLIKQRQLEKDMTKVLQFLSKKVTVRSLEELKKTPETKEKPTSQIPPSSMNEILTNLLKLDLHIEASAIIQNDGTILASAISSRISDSLFATIAQNLSMIGHDIIEGLSAGKLLNISIRGSEGVIDLAPIDTRGKVQNEMVLIIFSHPKVKSGIIHLAANIVKKQVIEYLGIKK